MPTLRSLLLLASTAVSVVFFVWGIFFGLSTPLLGLSVTVTGALLTFDARVTPKAPGPVLRERQALVKGRVPSAQQIRESFGERPFDPCTHVHKVEVTSGSAKWEIPETLVAWWCPTCETQLPVERN